MSGDDVTTRVQPHGTRDPQSSRCPRPDCTCHNPLVAAGPVLYGGIDGAAQFFDDFDEWMLAGPTVAAMRAEIARMIERERAAAEQTDIGKMMGDPALVAWRGMHPGLTRFLDLTAPADEVRS